MYFTLAVSAVTRQACAALVSAAASTDPRVMPMPGPPMVVWRAPDERAAVVCWGTRAGTEPAPRSYAGTIWAEADALRARTGVARVDPVYVAEVPGAAVVSDRACWAAAVAGRLGEYDPAMVGAFLAIGYPFGAATAFRKVRALGCGQMLTVTGARLVLATARDSDAGPAGAGTGAAGRYAAVAAALVEAALGETALGETALGETALGDAGGLIELSLTGGKDSRLIAAALTAAKVPFRARTHGFASHPDVVVAAMIAARLGVEHVVTEPKPPGAGQAPDEAALLGRLRSAVLVSDGMLSAYENIGTPDPHFAAEPVQAGGHGGELLRGGYATAAWHDRRSPGQARAWSEARGIELFRRMTTRRLGLLRRAAVGEYLASLTPCAVALPRGPLRALDHFYLVNRAGRWSATARQAYLMRSPLLQPFFSDRVIRAAHAVPLADRITDRLHREVLAVLCPDLLELPLAGGGWKSGPRNALGASPAAGASVAAGARPAATPDWRRHYGPEMARFLRDYTLDLGGAGPMFDIVRRQGAERVLRPPHTDPDAVWALATLAALLSGDWLNAREPKDYPGTRRVPGRDNADRMTG
jgi:asparagine synthase (glutamine-hydrolysing)